MKNQGRMQASLIKRILPFLMAPALLFSGCQEKDPAAVVVDTSTLPALQTGTTEQPEPNSKPDFTYTAPEMKGELTISLESECDIIYSGAELFMKKYPDVTITIDQFRETTYIELEGGAVMSGEPDEEFSRDNYLTQLNTKIMSGKAEDIFITDVLPVRKYIEMGALVDLGDYFSSDPEINQDDYYMSIINGKKRNGGLYEMPLNFFINTYLVNRELMDQAGLYNNDKKAYSSSEMLDTGIEMLEKTDLPNSYLSISSGASEAYNLILENIDEFADFDAKTFNFNQPLFKEILEKTKDLDNKGYFDFGHIDFYNMEYYFAYSNDFDTQSMVYALMEDSESYAFAQCDKSGNVEYRSIYNMGINNGSENKELAWEFIKFMISEEVQTLPAVFATGVNKSSLKPVVERHLSYMEFNATDVSDCIRLMESWINMAKSPSFSEMGATEIIYLEVRDYFDGEQTAEEAANAINTKLDKIYNE